MPRSDQPIRQWKILKYLEANGRATLARLSSALEETRHERTIRRDLEALSLAGFPIYDQREDEKTFWVLDPDYRRFISPYRTISRTPSASFAESRKKWS